MFVSEARRYFSYFQDMNKSEHTSARPSPAWFVKVTGEADNDWQPLWKRDSDRIEEHYQRGDINQGDISSITQVLPPQFLCLQIFLFVTDTGSPTFQRGLSLKVSTSNRRSRF